MAQILSIQYLRALAVLLVVIFHSNLALREEFAPDLFSFRTGATGVDIFFVISGFIMWTISASRPTTAKNFMTRRIVRIVPIYWALTLITAYISTDAGLHIEIAQDFGRILRSLFFIPQWNPDYPDQVSPTLIVGWSLNLEMIFYTIFAVSLFLRRSWQLPILLSVLFLMGTSRFYLGTPSHPAISLYSETMVLEFGFGILLGWAYLKGYHEKISTAQRWFLVIAFLTGAAHLTAIKPDLPPIRALTRGIPALFIVASGLLMEPLLSKRPIKTFKFLGDASYSIYLSHLMALALSQKLVGANFRVSMPIATLFGEVMFAMIIGGITYVILEKPLTSMVSQRIERASLRSLFPNKRIQK